MKSLENYSSIALTPSIATAKTKMTAMPPLGAEADDAPKMPKDKWEALELLVNRGVRAIEEERKISLVMERRANIMRRLADCLEIRDDVLTMPTLQEWLKTEVNLADLLVDYAPIQLEREKTLQLIKAQI